MQAAQQSHLHVPEQRKVGSSQVKRSVQCRVASQQKSMALGFGVEVMNEDCGVVHQGGRMVCAGMPASTPFTSCICCSKHVAGLRIGPVPHRKLQRQADGLPTSTGGADCILADFVSPQVAQACVSLACSSTGELLT